MAKFKQEILDKIASDADLYAAVVKALGISPSSLPMTLKRNGNNLNQFSIVTMVADHLGMDANDLVENEPVEAQN